jgi:hypothetical protein
MNPGRAVLLFPVLCGAILLGCAYSFTGSSVPTHLRTVAIPVIDDQSGFGEPGLRELFTQELTAQFITDNSLEVGDRTTADSILEGVVVTVTDIPSSVEEGEQVRKRRVTITAKFVYQDMKLRKKVWEKTFSNWGDYVSGTGLSQRSEGIREALRKLSEDVLLETVSGW